MANEEQLSILKQGVDVWNKWRKENLEVKIDLKGANFRGADLQGAILHAARPRNPNPSAEEYLSVYKKTDLRKADLCNVNLQEANLIEADLREADLRAADLGKALLGGADLGKSDLSGANLSYSNFAKSLIGTSTANLSEANLSEAQLFAADLSGALFTRCNFSKAKAGFTIFGNSDLSEAIGLEDIQHILPSRIVTDVFARSRGKIPEVFLKGCGLSDADIEYAKLHNPELSNEEINKILYKIYDFRATQAIQISPLFISYSHGDNDFVDQIGKNLTKRGIRYWRDIHDMKAGRMEKQIDRAIRQNPTVLLVLSEHSLSSDWVEHEVRTARGLEKEIVRDVLCPIALDNSWKESRWPKRVMEQIMEYNILDFSAWRDDSKFDSMFRKLIDGLELFYKG